MERPAAKTEWRQQLRTQRQALTSAAIESAGLEILQLLQKHPRWQAARTIGAYMALRGEPATQVLCQAVLDAGKTLVLPRISSAQTLNLHRVSQLDQLEASTKGILEPRADTPTVSPASLDILLIPGLAFDQQGHRLGQGGGFYDRLLASLPATTWRLGHAHAFQLLPLLPTEPHDAKVHAVVTPQGITVFPTY